MTGKDREVNSKVPELSRSNACQREWDELDSSTQGELEQKLAATVNRNDYAAIEAIPEAYFKSVQVIKRT
jgi:hypothetical protein